jgi:hypothetical protein
MIPASKDVAFQAWIDDAVAKVDALTRKIAAGLAAPRPTQRLKIAAVAQAFGVSAATVNRRVRKGRFPAPDCWIGPHRALSLAALEEWLAQEWGVPLPRHRRGFSTWSRTQHVAREKVKARQKGARS